MTLKDQASTAEQSSSFFFFLDSSSGNGQFFQGRDKLNFEFATAAEDALLSIAAA